MSHSIRNLISICVLLVGAQQLGSAQTIKLARVISKRVVRTTELPGEFYPFLSVDLRAKVSGYVDRVLVDRRSVVRQGELLVQLSAPELEAHIVQAEAQVTHRRSRTKCKLKLNWPLHKAGTGSWWKLRKLQVPVAENDLIQAKQQTDAAQALVRSRQRTVESLKGNLKSQRDLAAYLRVSAPFDGVITTRYIHPGALVGPGSDVPLLQLDQISHLRLTVAVPEAEVAGIEKGVRVDFRVPAHPERTFLA